MGFRQRPAAELGPGLRLVPATFTCGSARCSLPVWWAKPGRAVVGTAVPADLTRVTHDPRSRHVGEPVPGGRHWQQETSTAQPLSQFAADMPLSVVRSRACQSIGTT